MPYHTGEASKRCSPRHPAVLKLLTIAIYRWPPRLPDIFEKQGLRDVTYGRYATGPETRLFWTQLQCMVAEEYSFVAMDNSDPQSGGPAYRRRIQEAAKEAKEGAAISHTLEVTVGMKSKVDEKGQLI